MIERLPQWAEKYFGTLCANEGVVCNKAEEDESGWDFHVEFPQQPLAAPADMHPARNTAYVQVKSTRRRDGLVCRLKLSNALRAAQSLQPWFVVLVIADAANEPPSVYAVHIWDELIGRTLERVRRAENNHVGLNKRNLTIRFDAADERGHHLVGWMHDAIEAVGPDYQQRKKSIFQTIGYEESYGIVQVTMEPTTADEVLDNLLGVGSGIPLTRFVYRPSRFGIRSPDPEIYASSGVLHTTPNPTTTCEIRLRGPSTAAPMVLSGHMYSPSIPNLPFEQSRLRFSADFLEIIWSPGGKADCRIPFEGREKKDLISIENLSTLLVWCESGPVQAEIWLGGKRTIRGPLPLGQPNIRLDWERVAKIVRLLRSIAGPVEQSKIQLSLADLDSAARDLITFQQLVEETSVRFVFTPSTETPTEFSSLLYYFYADVCMWTFYALVERPICEDVVIEGRRRVTCGLPRRREEYVLRDAIADKQRMMLDDYEHILHEQEGTGTPLGLGDAHVFL
jgi:hypothetical protein